MICEEGAFEMRERVRRQLAAQERVARVREVYEGYHDWDWKAALLADLMLDETQFGGDRAERPGFFDFGRWTP